MCKRYRTTGDRGGTRGPCGPKNFSDAAIQDFVSGVTSAKPFNSTNNQIDYIHVTSSKDDIGCGLKSMATRSSEMNVAPWMR